MFGKKTADSIYFIALEKLAKAEKEFLAAVDHLEEALEAKRPDLVTPRRVKRDDLLTALKAAYGVAEDSHAAYWRERAAMMRPEVEKAAVLLYHYNQAARIGNRGMGAHSPALAVIDDVHSRLVAPMLAEIPIEGPDSEVLDEWTGTNRRRSELQRAGHWKHGRA